MSFEYQPTLTGALVELRPLRSQDYEKLHAAAADPLIWEQHPVPNRHEEPVFKAFFRDSLASGGALVATDITSQQIIGSSRFHGFSEERSEVEIGWTFLSRAYWGGVYNREIKRLMLGHAFRFVHRVIFLVGLHNVRSQRAVERIGATREGARPDDGGHESYVYQITPAAFEDQTGFEFP